MISYNLPNNFFFLIESLHNNLLCEPDRWPWHYHLIFIINRYSIFKTSSFYIIGSIFLRLRHFFKWQKLGKSSSSPGFRKNKSRPNVRHKQIRVFSLTTALLSELWLISPNKTNLFSLSLSQSLSFLSCLLAFGSLLLFLYPKSPHKLSVAAPCQIWVGFGRPPL